MDDIAKITAAIDLGTDSIRAGAALFPAGGGLPRLLTVQSEKCKPGTMNKGCAINADNMLFHVNSIATKLCNQSKLNLTRFELGFAGQLLQQSRPELLTTTENGIDYLHKRNGKTLVPCPSSPAEREAEALLTDEEKAGGCIFIDFGCGITSVVVYEDGAKVRALAWPAGSANITADMKYFLNGDKGYADLGGELIEKLVRAVGLDNPAAPDPKKKIVLTRDEEGHPNHMISTGEVHAVINARFMSNLSFVEQVRSRGWFKRGDRSIVISGGGSRLRNCAEALSAYAGVRVRRADASKFFEAGELTALMADPSMSGLASLLLLSDMDCTPAPEEPAQPKKKKKEKVSFIRGVKNLFSNMNDDSDEKI